MAEGLLKQALDAAGRTAIDVSSAGLYALVDQPADKRACELMRDQGVDISAHRARQLTKELSHGANLIVVMENQQKKLVEAMDQTARGKVYRLGQWRDRDVPDPYCQPDALYQEVFGLVREGVNDWVSKLTA
jgi:protein-tyrosine phosphatase